MRGRRWGKGPQAAAAIQCVRLPVAQATKPYRVAVQPMHAPYTTCTSKLGNTVAGEDVSFVAAGATGQFADKNVGDGKSVLISGVELGGVDSGNYVLSSVADSSANITRLNSVNWVGMGSTNNWFDAANWEDGAVPDLANVANVANAYLTWQADKELLKLTQDTLGAYEQSFKLTSRSNEVGVASALDLSQARTSVENARVALARYTRQVAQDENSLTLLLGTGIPANLQAAKPLSDDLLSDVPAGLPSDLLQRRPDILQAEYNLKAANANIGAARAAFFPSISLTANAGSLSPDLSGLFKGGSGTWLFQPQINLPIFNAGSLRASLDYSKIQKDINVAKYEKTIQTAFQEVSDGLAARKTFEEQLQAQRDLVAANQDYYRLAERRYRIGIDSNLTFLDAQRQLFSSQQSLITDRLSQLVSEVNLYKALGGGWNAQTAQNEPVSKDAPKLKMF